MSITKISPDLVDFDSALVVSPTLTIGDATAQDTKIVFDGNAQDYYIGLDDSADDLVIGLGSAVGTTPAIVIDENLNVGVGETSPDRLFHVKRSDSGGTVAKFENSAGTVYIELNTANQAGGDAGYLSYDSNKNLGLWTDDTQRITIDSVGTLRVGNPAGVPTPGSGWDANLDAIQVGEASAFRSGDSDYSAATVVSTNIYQTGGGDKLLNGTDLAAQYLQQGGNHYFYGYNSGSADATPAVDADDLANPVIIYKGGGLSISGGSVANTANGKAGIFWHGNPANGADYCIRRTNDAWSGSNYAQLLIDWDTGVKIDVGNSAYGKSYLEVNGNVKFTAAGQGVDFSATNDITGSSSELLDDYEEGLHAVSVVGHNSGSYTLSTNSDHLAYTKIGRQVTVTGYLGITSDNSANGTIKFSLPYACENLADDTEYAMSAIGLINTGSTTLNDCSKHAFVFAGSYAYLYKVNDNGTAAYIQASDVDTSFQIVFTFSYFTAT